MRDITLGIIHSVDANVKAAGGTAGCRIGRRPRVCNNRASLVWFTFAYLFVEAKQYRCATSLCRSQQISCLKCLKYHSHEFKSLKISSAGHS